jgi:hypothetical protein
MDLQHRMAEDTQVSAPAVSGNSELSAPNISGAVEGQQKSAGQREEFDLAKEFREMRAEIEQVRRVAQGEKDRGVNKVRTELDELKRALGYLEKHKDPEKAAREMILDDMVAERTTPAETSPKVSKDEELKVEYKSRIEKHLKKVGIPEAEWASATESLKDKSFDSVDDAVFAAMEAAQNYKVNKGKQSAPATTAAVSTQIRATSTHESTTEEVAEEYTKLARGNLRDPKTVTRMKELKAMLDKESPVDYSVT